jgi:aquaporin related protein
MPGFASRFRNNDRVNRDTAPRTGRPTFTDHLGAAFIEFIGTTFFLLFAFGGIQAAAATVGVRDTTSANILFNLYTATVIGLSLAVSTWLFYRRSGGLFNPNVSLALLLTGFISPVRFVLYAIAQIVGGIAAAGLILALLPGRIASNTILSSDTNTAQGVFIEMFITAALVLAALVLAAEKSHEKARHHGYGSTTGPGTTTGLGATSGPGAGYGNNAGYGHEGVGSNHGLGYGRDMHSFGPLGVGFTQFICTLFAIYYTGAAMNTARAFGPAVVSGFPFDRHWIYWVGPALGSLLGAGLYALMRFLHYYRLNSDSDYDHTGPHMLPDTASTTQGEYAQRHSGQAPLTAQRDPEAALGVPTNGLGSRRV